MGLPAHMQRRATQSNQRYRLQTLFNPIERTDVNGSSIIIVIVILIFIMATEASHHHHHHHGGAEGSNLAEVNKQYWEYVCLFPSRPHVCWEERGLIVTHSVSMSRSMRASISKRRLHR